MDFEFDNGNIFYTDSGKGTVVILIHGYLESGEIWNSFAEKLSETYRVICIDLPGHGKSDVYGDCHSMEFMASGLYELLSSLNTGPVFLAGHSLGGYVTLAFAEKFPEMLSGYILFHSHPFADTPATREKRDIEIGIIQSGGYNIMYPANIRKMYAGFNLDRFAEAVKRSDMIASALPGKGVIALLSGMKQRPSRLSVVESGKKPLLWIFGAADNFIQYETMLSSVRLPLNASVHILEESGHMGFVEEEDNSLNAFTAFINSHTGK